MHSSKNKTSHKIVAFAFLPKREEVLIPATRCLDVMFHKTRSEMICSQTFFIQSIYAPVSRIFWGRS